MCNVVIQLEKLEINAIILYKAKIGNSAKSVKSRLPLMNVNVNINYTTPKVTKYQRCNFII